MSPSTLYTVGGTVHVNSCALYIRRNADEELMALCRAGTFAYVLTARQLGKSSLMVQTAYTLSKEGCCCASVDLTILGTHATSASEWYLSLLEQLEEELELKTDTLEWWEDHAHLAVSYRFIKFFKEVVMSDVMTSVVIFFDEIDSTLKLPFSDDFFAAIRALYNARAQEPELKRLTFVLIGLATPSDLIMDPQRTPFNIGQRVELTDFTAQEAAPLAKGLNLSPAGSLRASDLLNQVHKWTNGHPYLTQRLCEALAKHPEPIHSLSDVDQIVRFTLLGEEGMKDHNLQFVHNMLTIRADDQIAVLATYRDIRTGWIPIRHDKHSRIHTHLKLSGVVRQQGKILQVRNRIYEEVFNKRWIKEQWPLNWWETLSFATKVSIFSTILMVSALFLVLFIVRQQQKTEAAQKETSYALATAQVAIQQESQARATAEVAKEQESQARAEAEVAWSIAEAAKEVALAEAETNAEMAQIAESKLLVNNIQFNYSDNPDDALLSVLKANTMKVENKSPEVSKALSWIVEETKALRHVLSPSKSDAIQWVEWRPDGRQVLIGGHNDQNLYIWDEKTDELDHFPEYNGHIWQVKWNQDQLQVLRTDENGEITLQNHEDRKILHSTNLLESEESKEIEPQQLNRLRDPALRARVEEAVTDQLLASNNLSMPIKFIKWSPNQRNVLIYYQNETIKIWNASNNQFHDVPNEVFSAMTLVEWHPNGQELLIGRDNGEALTFDWPTKEVTFLLKRFDSAIRSAAWSRDGHSIVIGRDNGSIQIWDRINDQVTTFKEDSTAPIRAIAWHPDEEQLVTGDEEGKIRIWHRNGTLLKSVSGHSAAITALQWHPDGQEVITGSEDGTVRIWEATIDQRTLSQSASSAPETNSKPSNESTIIEDELNQDQSAFTEQIKCDSAVDFDKQSASLWSTTWNFIGAQILTTGDETCAKIWKVANSTLQSTFEAHQDDVWATAWSLDGDYLLTSSIFTNKTRVWNAATGDHVRSLLSGDGNHFAYSAAWHPSTKQVLAGRLDGRAHIWDAITGEKEQTFAKTGITSTISAVAWHPNGQEIVTAHWDGRVHRWDVATGVHLQAFDGHPNKIVWSVAWRADGQQIATGSKDHTIRIWNAETGQLEQVLEGHSGTVLSLAWHPDRNARPQLLTGSNDNTAKLWDTSTGTVLDTIRHSDNVVSVAWRPDGQQFLTASSNREIEIRVADDSLLMAKLIESVCKVWGHDELAIKSQIEDWGGCGRELALVADKIERYNTLRGLE